MQLFAGYTPPKGKTVLAYAPHCPVPRQERWYAILADAPNNAVLVWTPVNLVEAERAGIETARRDRLARKAAIEDSSGGKGAFFALSTAGNFKYACK